LIRSHLAFPDPAACPASRAEPAAFTSQLAHPIHAMLGV
jgi:hypothetical protein